jgi:putative flippase GtrA
MAMSIRKIIFHISSSLLLAINKRDLIYSLIIAEADAWLLLYILKATELSANISEATLIGQVITIFLRYLPIILPLLAALYILVGSFFKEKLASLFQLFKFVLIGSLNTFIDFSVLNFLMALFQITGGIYFTAFKAISFTFSAINSYFWNKFWTFEKKQVKKTTREFAQFYLITFISLTLNVSIATLIVAMGPQWGLTEAIWANIGAFGGVLIAFTFNFLGYKFIVFKK